jgi:methyl-accepting chemotaxis protein
VIVAAFGLLILSGFWIHNERSNLLAEKQEEAKNLVAVPYSIITQQYRLEKEGKISRGEAQRRAIEALKGIRYDGDNYFWINDMHPTMVMHPVKAQLDGEDLTNYKDSSGKALFVEMVRTVRKDGQGFVRYQWPRPGNKSERPVAKLSFVKGC